MKDQEALIGRVEGALRTLEEQFGPGFSNGVHAILLHDEIAETFEQSEWNSWAFRPSAKAFERAHEMGLIEPAQEAERWSFTQLGLGVRARLRTDPAS